MPIIIDRKTGEVLASQKLTQDQKDKLWEAYVRAYICRHPEIFNRREPVEVHELNGEGDRNAFRRHVSEN